MITIRYSPTLSNPGVALKLDPIFLEYIKSVKGTKETTSYDIWLSRTFGGRFRHTKHGFVIDFENEEDVIMFKLSTG